MVLCSKSSALLEGAFRRAFFYSVQSRLLFILLAVVLHAALLSSLPTNSSLRSEPRQTLSVHLERHQPVQTVSITSAFSSNESHALVPMKAKPKTAVVKPGLPKVIAESPSKMSRNELAAAPPQAAPASAGPVLGLALPQLGVAGGHRRLWSVQQDGTMPDEQVLLQAQRQRAAQLAIQAAQIAEREKFETRLMGALDNVLLNSPCRVVISSDKPAHIQCENEFDADSLRTVLNQIGEAPVVATDASSLIIDLTPRQSGGTHAISRHSNSAS